MVSSWIYNKIYPLETSLTGSILANASLGNHLNFEKSTVNSEDYINISLFLSDDYGLNFTQVKKSF